MLQSRLITVVVVCFAATCSYISGEYMSAWVNAIHYYIGFVIGHDSRYSVGHGIGYNVRYNVGYGVGRCSV